jgi:ArsR family metal-binding transcriptional regulator
VYIIQVKDVDAGLEVGEASCLAFAVLLIQQKLTLDEYLLLLHDPTFSDRRATLEAML